MGESRRCVLCQTRPRRSAHANTKYCEWCRQERLTRPKSSLSPEQGAEVLRLAGTIPKRDLCQRLGISWASVSRFLREQRVKRPHYNAYPPDIVAAVLAAYAAAPTGNGKRSVQERFPGVSVRSIVERHRHAQRQIRWTDAQMVEAARMAGLVSHTAQARYFNRPFANTGAMKKLWVRRFRCPPRDVHGLAAQHVWRLALPGVPAVVVRPANGAPGPAYKILWLDLVHWLRPDVAPEIQRAIAVLARFQAWLLGHDSTARIQLMIQERERYAADR